MQRFGYAAVSSQKNAVWTRDLRPESLRVLTKRLLSCGRSRTVVRSSPVLTCRLMTSQRVIRGSGPLGVGTWSGRTLENVLVANQPDNHYAVGLYFTGRQRRKKNRMLSSSINFMIYINVIRHVQSTTIWLSLLPKNGCLPLSLTIVDMLAGKQMNLVFQQTKPRPKSSQTISISNMWGQFWGFRLRPMRSTGSF